MIDRTSIVVFWCDFCDEERVVERRTHDIPHSWRPPGWHSLDVTTYPAPIHLQIGPRCFALALDCTNQKPPDERDA